MQEKEGAEAVRNLWGLFYNILFAAAVMLFIDGETGWLLIYVIVIAALASVIPVILSRRKISAEMDGFVGVVSVGDRASVRLTVSAQGFCFAPFVRICGSAGGQPFVAKTSLALRNRAEIELYFRQKECGLHEIEVSELCISDFFGIVRFKRQIKLKACVGVLPRIVDYDGPRIQPASIPSDDERESGGSIAFFGGTAGYEHREYAAGDSLRRVNYKLSAKKRRLMVRLDEGAGMQTTNIIIAADADGSCAEQALALAKLLVEMGAPVVVYHAGEHCEASVPSGIDKLREWLAFRSFGAGDVSRYPLPRAGANVFISAEGISVVGAC